MDRARKQESGFQLASPLVGTDRLLFERAQSVVVTLGLPGVAIHSTGDGTDPTETSPRYSGPLTISESGTLRVRAFHPAWQPSDVVERVFYRVTHRVHDLMLTWPPSAEYPGRGASTLLDHEGGGTDFRDGSWLGFRDHDVEAVLDLGAPVSVDALVVSCLVDNASWIFHPAEVRVETSVNGTDFSEGSREHFREPPSAEQAGQRFIRLPVDRSNVRYLRVAVTRRAALPEWHAGAGGQPWLFVDAIAVV